MAASVGFRLLLLDTPSESTELTSYESAVFLFLLPRAALSDLVEVTHAPSSESLATSITLDLDLALRELDPPLPADITGSVTGLLPLALADIVCVRAADCGAIVASGGGVTGGAIGVFGRAYFSVHSRAVLSCSLRSRRYCVAIDGTTGERLNRHELDYFVRADLEDPLSPPG